MESKNGLYALLAVSLAIAGCGSGSTTTGEIPSKPPSAATAQGDPAPVSKTAEAQPSASEIERPSGGALGSEGTSKQDAGPAPGDITGTWYGRLSPTTEGASPEQSRQLRLIAEAMFVDLELGKDGKFSLTAPGMPLTGTYEKKGDKLILSVETVMGRTLAQASSEFGPTVDQFKEPLEGQIRKDEKTLFFAGKKDQPGEMDMTFMRTPPADEKVGKRSVTPAEAKHVGHYTFDESFDPPGEDERSQQVMRSLASNASLALREDNTFVMKLMMRVTGSWKLEKDLIVLTVKAPRVMLEQVPPDQKPEIKARLDQGGKRLLMLNDKSEAVDFALKRT